MIFVVQQFGLCGDTQVDKKNKQTNLGHGRHLHRNKRGFLALAGSLRFKEVPKGRHSGMYQSCHTNPNTMEQAGTDTMQVEQDNIVRILVSTDNHVGYLERDAIRGKDSYDTFREVLQIALEKKVLYSRSPYVCRFLT
jgi:hypothetical protein